MSVLDLRRTLAARELELKVCCIDARRSWLRDEIADLKHRIGERLAEIEQRQKVLF